MMEYPTERKEYTIKRKREGDNIGQSNIHRRVLKENPNVECHYITEKEIVGICECKK